MLRSVLGSSGNIETWVSLDIVWDKVFLRIFMFCDEGEISDHLGTLEPQHATLETVLEGPRAEHQNFQKDGPKRV